MPDTDIIAICPYCYRENDVATSVTGEATPDEGCVSICWGCGHPAVFDFSCVGNVRRPTLAEYITIMADPTMQKALQVYQVARTPYEANRMMKE